MLSFLFVRFRRGVWGLYVNLAFFWCYVFILFSFSYSCEIWGTKLHRDRVFVWCYVFILFSFSYSCEIWGTKLHRDRVFVWCYVFILFSFSYSWDMGVKVALGQGFSLVLRVYFVQFFYSCEIWGTKLHRDRVFSEYFDFPLSVSFHRRSLFVLSPTQCNLTSG